MSTIPDVPISDVLAALDRAAARVVGWVPQLREAPGRFRWARESTRGANVAATAYLLMGLQRMGIQGRVITPDDTASGIAWARAMHRGNGQYYDPALLDRPTPGWPADKPWPDPAMQEGVNQYAHSTLKGYGVDMAELPPPEPPPGWPQLADGPDAALAWIRSRPYAENAWGACSHGQRLATRLLQWHQAGHMTLEPLLEALRFFYQIQDPATGLWGTPSQPRHVRINGAFKLFPLMREALDLPIPHADAIIDQVLAEFNRPDYDATVGACDEWDNWYVLALLVPLVPEHRREEIRRLAAWRLVRSLAIFSEPDGGLSYHSGRCITGWIGFDMAPSLPQGDAMGPGILSAGINVCIDLLGLQGKTSWTGVWRMRTPEPAPLRAEIMRRLM